MQRALCLAAYLLCTQGHVLAVSSPAARRSSGTHPASCSSPRQTRTASCPPLCWPSGWPWMEKRAGGNQGCSSELKWRPQDRNKNGPRWKVAGTNLTPQAENSSMLVDSSMNILHTGPWAVHQDKEMSTVTHVLRDLSPNRNRFSSQHSQLRRTIQEP